MKNNKQNMEPANIGERYFTKFQVPELVEIVGESKQEYQIIYIGKEHLGVCPIPKDRINTTKL